MPSFATALSGLESNNTALNTIANNLANMNTVGYKAQTDQFSTLFYQQLNGGVNGGVQVGVGTQIATTETDFSNGGPTSTGQSTDMALQGNGFFVIDDHGQQELTLHPRPLPAGRVPAPRPLGVVCRRVLAGNVRFRRAVCRRVVLRHVAPPAAFLPAAAPAVVPLALGAPTRADFIRTIDI